MPAHQHRLGSGLEERAVAGGEGGKHAAGGNGEGEVPGRGDDDDSQWVHLAANEIGRHLFERARIVAGEVDGLRDLRVGLGHRLGAVDDHGADEVGATAGEDECGLVEEGAALRGRTGGPRGLGGAGCVERAVYLGAIGQRVAVGDALGERPVAGFDLGGAFEQLAGDLQGDGLGRAGAPARDHGVDPFPVGGDGPVCVGFVGEGFLGRFTLFLTRGLPPH